MAASNTKRIGVDAGTWGRFRGMMVNGKRLEGELHPIIADTTTQWLKKPDQKFDGKIPSVYCDKGIGYGYTEPLLDRARSPAAKLNEWQSCPHGPYNIGVLARTIRALDVDVTDPALAAEISAVIESHIVLPKRTRADSTKFLMPFLLDGVHPKRRIKTRAGWLEFLGDGQQWVIAGTHKDGAQLEWSKLVSGEWVTQLPVTFPTVKPEVFEELWQDLARFAVEPPKEVRPNAERPTREQLAPTAELAELRRLISKKDPSAPYDEWLRIGAILHHETDGSDEGLELWDEWSSAGSNYKGIEDLEPHWNSFGNAPNPATAGSLRRAEVGTLDELGPPTAQVAAAPAVNPDEDIMASVEERVTFKFIPIREFIKNEPVSYLVQDLIEEGQLLGFIGQRKGGKSYAALDLAYAVAQGRRWANHEVIRQGRVMWIAAEGARSFERRRGPQWDALYGPADIYVWPYPLNMRKRETFEGLAEACKGAALVVIDSLRRVTPGAKENASDELSEVLAYAEQLTRVTGATVLFVAHAGKGDPTVARGTSAIEDAFESAFAIEKIDDTPKFKLTPVFARDEDSGDGAAMFFTLTEINPEGCASSGMIVNWNTEAPPRKSDKTWEKLSHGVKVLALVDEHEEKSLSRDFIHAECRARYPEGTAPAALEKRLNEELRAFVKDGTLVEVIELAALKCVREHKSSRAANYNDSYVDSSALFKRGLARVKGNPDHARGAREVATDAADTEL